MGVLAALDNLPYLLFGLLVGPLVDRRKRRPLMIRADLMRALAILLPIMALSSHLSFPLLGAIAFAVGVGNIVFDVACQAQMPELVEAKGLVAANGELQAAIGIASLAAPGLAGILISAVGAPLALVSDAASYLVSAVSILALRRASPAESEPGPRDTRPLQEILAGIAEVRSDRRLAGIGLMGAFTAIGLNALSAVLLLVLARSFGLGVLGIGLVFAAFALGAAAVGLGADRFARRLGPGPLLAAGPALASSGFLPVLVAATASIPTFPLVHVGAAVAGFGVMLSQTMAAGLRQSIAPARSRGRILGTLRFLEWGAMPIGALAGGAFGQTFGLLPSLAFAACLLALAALPVTASGLVHLRALPSTKGEPGTISASPTANPT